MGVWQEVAMDFLKFPHGLPIRHALHFTPSGQATLKTALWPFQVWPARKVDSLRPSSTSLDTPRRTPMEPGRREPGKSCSLRVEGPKVTRTQWAEMWHKWGNTWTVV
jgi:hypothetical protein